MEKLKSKRYPRVVTFLLMSFFMAIALGSFAQQKSIKGEVTDSENVPIPGVTVLVKGTTIGTVTDMNGKYSLMVPANAQTISFSYIGMLTQEIQIAGKSVINVTLLADVIGIEEVVAVGYATRKAGEVTGSVSVVQSADIQKMQIKNVSEALRGVAGVTVLESNTPGEGATIRVRGLGTINNNDPLWVVDGVPGATVNPNNIESITILKDAASQAIYGARAANGVVLVTTKSGKKNQKAQFNINIKSGISQNSNYYHLLNAQEYGEMLWLEAKNTTGATTITNKIYGTGTAPQLFDYVYPNMGVSGSVDESKYDYLMVGEDGTDTNLITKMSKGGTDWLREADRNAKYTDVAIDLTGGSDNTMYSFQAGYLDQEGIMKWTGYKRYNLQSNITSNVTDWLEVGERIGTTYSEDTGYQTDNGESSAISWAYRMPPMIPVKDIAGNYAGTRNIMGNAQNPIFILDKNQNDIRRQFNASGNIYAKAKILPGLSVKTLFGANYYSYHSKDINYVEKGHAERGTYDYLYETGNFSRQWNWTNTIEYNKTFGSHNLSVIIGTEAIDYRFNQMYATRYDYFLKTPNYIQLSTGLQGQANSGYLTQWSLFSEFGRINYSYADRYLVEAVVRRDGSSRFAKNYRYGIFPAFSLGWRISNEPFMAGTKNWLDAMKLRGGWGTTGNDQVGGNYNSYTQFGLHVNDSFYGLNGQNGSQGSTGFYQTTFGNENVKWETTRTTNVGFDATLFKNLDVTLDVWQRRTTNMLFAKAIPQVMGQATAPSVNVGEMLNKGFDIAIGYRGSALNNELKYNVNLDVSHYKNEIVKLAGISGEVLQGSAYREQIYTRTQKGRSFPEFFGYTVEGIFQTADEAAAWPKAFGATGTYNKPGHFKYKDLNDDKVINDLDRTYIGSPHPDFTAGLNLSVTYKGFDLYALFYTSYGNDMVNYVRRFTDFVQFAGGRSYDRLYNSWGSPYLKDNTKAKLPMAESDDTQSQVVSTAFIEDASYLRLKNLKVGYDLNRVLKTKLRSLQIFGQVSNLFTITKYSGLDPEVNIGGANMGVDQGAWPTPRQILFGVNIGI
ncbi:MAG TPA: TonB-dependent receptor [Prolixibacteraceae bacterium]|nr:TonB-dependent receptor [Prolixibacteraceae bacterium]